MVSAANAQNDTDTTVSALNDTTASGALNETTVVTTAAPPTTAAATAAPTTTAAATAAPTTTAAAAGAKNVSAAVALKVASAAFAISAKHVWLGNEVVLTCTWKPVNATLGKASNVLLLVQEHYSFHTSFPSINLGTFNRLFLTKSGNYPEIKSPRYCYYLFPVWTHIKPNSPGIFQRSYVTLTIIPF